MAYDRPDIEEPTHDKPPPDVYQECRRVLSKHQLFKGRWPAMMDRHLEHATRWWVDEMQEPFNDRFETPRLVPLAGLQKGVRWVSPYQERVVSTLRAFLRADDKHQRMIVAAREEGIWWRGEPDWQFPHVIREMDYQRQMGAENYRFEAVRWMKSLKIGKSLPYDKDKRDPSAGG